MSNVATLTPNREQSGAGILNPQNLQEAFQMAEIMADSSIVPKDFAGRPANILVAVQWGSELGLSPMQAMQNIAVINGRPSLWGDAVLAIVLASPACEYVKEELVDTNEGLTAVCYAKRVDQEEQSRSFSWVDAEKAGLATKTGPWSNYPKRMLQMRARAFALRDVFADLLRGMHIAEESQDLEERDITPKPEKSEAPGETKALPLYDKFDENFDSWRNLIASGKKSAEDVIRSVQSRATLTEEQKTKLRNVEVQNENS